MTLRVAVVSTEPAFADGTGGEQRVAHIVEGLRALGCEVDFVRARVRRPDLATCSRRERWEYLLRCYVLGNALDGATKRELAVLAAQRPDVVIVRPAQVLPAVRRVLVGVPCVVDVDDLAHEVLRSRAGVVRHPARRALLLALAAVSRATLGRSVARAEHAWVAAAEDLAEVGSERVSVLPNVLPKTNGLSESSTPVAATTVPSGPPRFLALGTLSNRHYAAGVERFLRSGWQEVRAVQPDAELAVIGRGAPADLNALLDLTDGVTAFGWVADVAAEYARADVCLVLNLTGGGTKIKLLEALAHGRPVVATEHAARGTAPHLRDGEHLLVRPLNDVASAALALVADSAHARSLGVAGQAAVCAHFSDAAVRAEIARTLGALPGVPSPLQGAA